MANKNPRAGRPKVYKDGGSMQYYRLPSKKHGRRLRSLVRRLKTTVAEFSRDAVLERMEKAGG